MKKTVFISFVLMLFSVCSVQQCVFAVKPFGLSLYDKVYLQVSTPSQDVEKFKQYFDGESPFVVNFYATWCSTCRLVEPVYNSVADEYSNKTTFFAFDIDKHPQLAANFKVRLLPTIYVVYPPDEEIVEINTNYLLDSSYFKSKLDTILNDFNQRKKK